MHPRSARSDRTDRSTDRPTDRRPVVLFGKENFPNALVRSPRAIPPLVPTTRLRRVSLSVRLHLFSPLHYLFILFFLPLFLSCYERNFGERATSRRALRGIRVTKIIGESGAGARRGWEEAARGGTGVVRLIGNAAVAMHKRRQFKGEREREKKRMDDDHALFGSLAICGPPFAQFASSSFSSSSRSSSSSSRPPCPSPSPLHRQGVPVHPDGVYAPQMSAVENTDVCTRVLPRSSPVRNIVRPLRGPRVRSPPSDVRRLLSLLLPAVLLLHPLSVCLPPAASPLLPLLFCRCTCHPCLW